MAHSPAQRHNARLLQVPHILFCSALPHAASQFHLRGHEHIPVDVQPGQSQSGVSTRLSPQGTPGLDVLLTAEATPCAGCCCGYKAAIIHCMQLLQYAVQHNDDAFCFLFGAITGVESTLKIPTNITTTCLTLFHGSMDALL